MQETQSDMDATTSSSELNLDLPPGLIPWAFQIEGASWLRQHPRSILGDHMGLGKTLTSTIALSQDRAQLPSLLIVCTNAAKSTWIEHLDYLRVQPALTEMVTFQKLNSVLEVKPHWHTVIFDCEVNMLRNRKARTLYVAIKEKLTCIRMWFVTGTPVVSGADNLWTLLNLINPKRFSSYWSFAQQYCWVLDNGFGKSVEGVRNADNLRELLKGYMLRRTVSQVFPQLPLELRRQVVKLEPTKIQKQLLKGLGAELEAELDSGKFILSPNKLAAEMRMRQILVSPKLLGFDDNGAAMEALENELPAEEPCVIFTPFKASFRTINQVLQPRPVFKIDGDMTVAQRDRTLFQFRTTIAENRNPVMHCTISIGTSFSLPEEVRIGLFIGYEWVPAMMHQAEARFFRPARGDRGRVAKYISHEGTIDSRIMDVLDGKVTVANLILDKYSKGRNND